MKNKDSSNNSNNIQNTPGLGNKSQNAVPGLSSPPPGHSHRSLVYWGIFLIFIAIIAAVLYAKIGDWALSLSDTGLNVKLSQPSTTILALDPQTATVTVGDTLKADVILDTGNENIDGVDIYALHFDPSLLKVLDDEPKQSGIQIKPGDILTLNAANIVDQTSGTIKFGQVAVGGTSYHGKGVLATIHFKAMASGTAYLRFDFRPGNTIDSNAAYKGKDRLAKVVDAIYTIQAK
jgi:hypothetical protein